MGELFNRQCIVQMGTVLVNGLRVQFKIDKHDAAVPSSAEISVWNLARETRARIVAQSELTVMRNNKNFPGGIPVILMAGYGTDLSQLFNGDIMPYGLSIVRSGPDWLTKFKVGDGMLSYQTDRVQASVPKGSSIKQIILQLLKCFHGVDTKKVFVDIMSGKIPLTGAFQQLFNAGALSGRAMDEMNRLLARQGLKCTVVDGSLEFTPLDPAAKSLAWPADLIPDLTPRTGLIGSPEAAKDKFIKFRCLLRPAIKPNRMVRVVWSEHPAGLYIRAQKITHTGDTRGQEWYTDVEGKAVEAQAP